MTDPPFPDVEAAALDRIASLVDDPDKQTGTTTPDDFAGKVFIRVTRIGGPSDRFNDYPRLSVDVLSTTRAQAVVVAEQVRQLITAAPWRAGTTNIDTASCSTGPFETAWDRASRVRRWTANYELSLRR